MIVNRKIRIVNILSVDVKDVWIAGGRRLHLKGGPKGNLSGLSARRRIGAQYSKTSRKLHAPVYTPGNGRVEANCANCANSANTANSSPRWFPLALNRDFSEFHGVFDLRTAVNWGKNMDVEKRR